MDPNQEQEKNKKQQQQERLVKDNQYAILFQENGNSKMVQLRAGDKYQTQSGAYRYINMINIPWGSTVKAFNKQEHIRVLEPRSVLITDNLSRKTQILYSMDNSAILFKLDIRPGQTVVEAGTGSGSLSCAISQLLGEKGRLLTFQFNKQRAQITKQFFQKLEKTNVTSTWRDVVNNGFQIQGQHFEADALFLDIPNPWAALQHAKNVLKKNGRICCFSPCIQQVQKTTQQMRKMKFKKIETHECLIRAFQIQRPEQNFEGLEPGKRWSVYSRTVHNNRGHTGYLTFAIV